MLHKQSKEIIKQKVGQGEATYRQILISPEEGPNFAMRKFTIEPEGFMPLHTNEVEHEQYVLNGTAELRIGNERIIAKKDDVIFIPSGVEHDYRNIGNAPFEFLCIVPNKKDEIKIIS